MVRRQRRVSCGFFTFTKTSRKPQLHAYSVNRKSYGEKTLTLRLLLPAIFLHQRHNEAASVYVVIRIVVFLLQYNAVLRVDPECVCKRSELKPPEKDYSYVRTVQAIAFATKTRITAFFNFY